jgi:hypothetical protein
MPLNQSSIADNLVVFIVYNNKQQEALTPHYYNI